ncbi:unnamed protein product [Parascedosporium putredinis]|uniref:Uncharacterized protein n=1 Tax=Parascedosporium putredinis TaxID=1442378 RepID=A0A9P1MEF0_9PEZI|nr:unnamed protein product [Parascedosporium putredinis]CAI8000327.1 unnamed protein product [Parascedosporium putredinis]
MIAATVAEYEAFLAELYPLAHLPGRDAGVPLAPINVIDAIAETEKAGAFPSPSRRLHSTKALRSKMAQLNLLKELRAGAHKNGLLYPREFREAAEKKRTREKIRRTIQRQFDELQYRHAYLTRAVGTHRRDARAAAADMEALEQEIRKEVLAAGYSSIDGMMEATATLQRGLTRQLRNSPEMVGGANTAPSVEKSSLLCLSIC